MPLDASEIHSIAQTWIELHRLPEDSQKRKEKFWAYHRLCNLIQDNAEEAWKVIETIRRLDGSDLILSNLAAGPVEDLLVAHGDIFVDRFENLARSDQQFR